MRRFGILFLFLLLSVGFSVAQTVLPGGVAPVVTVADDSVMVDDAPPLSALPWPENVQEVLDSLLFAPLFETSHVSLVVYDLTADSTLYYRSPRSLMRPASTLKLLTAVTALDRLGYDHTIRTSIYYTGIVDSLRTLQGDVYVKGAFDPRFDSEDLQAFADALLTLGIDTLRGNFYADMSMKDNKLLGEGWCWDDDNPVLSPLLLNRKNNLVSSLVQLLRSRGLTIIGLTDEQRTVPSEAILLTTRYHGVGELLRRTLKNSDNLYAEALFYQVAASRASRGASAKDAVAVERELLERIGIASQQYRIADGSGLSLYNHLTAELEVKLLRYAYCSPNIFNPLYEALPIAGVDGTLSGRMRGTAAAGNVRAKTGTLESVSTLAGYCRAYNGHMLCFAIMNNGLRNGNDGRRFQNRVCVALCQRYME